MDRKTRQKLAKNIKVRRTEMGLDQRSCAEAAKISPSMLCQIESCTRKPSLDVLARVSKVFRVRVQDLFSDQITVKI